MPANSSSVCSFTSLMVLCVLIRIYKEKRSRLVKMFGVSVALPFTCSYRGLGLCVENTWFGLESIL